jgi:hypothetical protein
MEGVMLVYVFRKKQGWQRVLTLDKSGGVLPEDGRPWPWLLEKSIEIKEADGPRIGASSKEILDGIAKDGYFLWPAAETDGGWVSSG